MVNPKDLDWTQTTTIPHAFGTIVLGKLEDAVSQNFRFPKLDLQVISGYGNGDYWVAWSDKPMITMIKVFVMFAKTHDISTSSQVYRAIINPNKDVYYTNATHGENFESWCKAISDSVTKSLRELL